MDDKIDELFHQMFGFKIKEKNMLHVYMVRKTDDKYVVRLVNSVVSSTGIKTSATLTESKIPMTAEIAVERGEALIDAFINAGMSVEPALNLAMEEGVGNEN